MTPHDANLKELLNHAIALLDDVKSKFGLFERQEYARLRKRFDEHAALPGDLHALLDDIDTSDAQQ
ncbi:hypothetical protein DYU05_03830 [Mucilaginibacter terrenus]|uniref:Uncharacterized protein n=1 Tax=Mucilaginibacter terrenus TaxID=2482727 RepID=A0A3E2NUQ3_9SPHI|nr:hypothetical protein [Mucilaginibacter terrenus]RFZ84746.1 hypothetical protein DYU05_03830 [Mucilaginibacter terrenus]